MIDELDPTGFVVDELVTRGALVERAGTGDATALLPPALAASLGLPDVATLSRSPAPAAGFCGLGAPVLDRLIREARATAARSAVTWAAEPPRAASVDAAAARIVARNGVIDALGTGTATVTYLFAAFAWVAEADERYQGLCTVIVDAATGAEPDPLARAAIGALVAGGGAPEAAPAAPAAPVGLVAARCERRVLAEVDTLAAAVRRRRDREAERQRAYFRQLVAEACARRWRPAGRAVRRAPRRRPARADRQARR